MNAVIPRGALGYLLVLASCGRPADPNLPTIQAESAHFRYHADPPLTAPTAIRGALEANRSDVLSYFGLADDTGAVIDYFWLDPRGVAAACSDDTTCAHGNQVISFRPNDRHALMHAYLSSAGDPPRPIREGVAEAVTCYVEDHGYDPAYAHWQDLFAVADDTTSEFYAAAMRLVRFLLLQYGPDRFIQYYGAARATSDPTVFATDFLAFWSLSIDDAWAAANAASDVPIVPVCPCRQTPIEPGPNPFYLLSDEYHPLGTEAGGSAVLTYNWVAPPTMLDCDRVQAPVDLSTQPLGGFSTGVVLMQLDDQRHYFTTQEYDVLTLADGTPLNANCGAATPFPVGFDLGQLGVVLPRGAPPAYLRLSPVAALNLSRIDQESGGLRLCSDCTPSSCQPVAADPTSTVVPAAGAVLEIDASSLSGPGLAHFFAAFAARP